MKKWQETQRIKNHQRRIQSAKPAIKSIPPRSSTASLANRGKTQPKSGGLLPLLKQFGIQQYFRKLKQRGFDTQINRLLVLNNRGFAQLMEDLSVVPGHISRFRSMTSLLKDLGQQKLPQSKPLQQKIPIVKSFSNMQTQPKSSHQSSFSIPDIEQTLALQSMHKQLENARNLIAKLEAQLAVVGESPIQPKKKNKPEILDPVYSQPFQDNKTPSAQNLNREQVGKSIDSSKIRSTLVKIDIEEMCRCLSRALTQHIQESEDQNQRSDSKLGHFLSQIFVEQECDLSNIYYFIRNLVSRAQLQNQVPILALVYIDRFVQKTGIRLFRNNWKRIVFISFVEASKVWDDESFQNTSFAEAFTRFTIQEINQMEEVFLTLLDFQLRVNSSDYAKAYFMLRSYTTKKDSSFPLQAIDIDTIMRLQNNCLKVREELEQTQLLAKSV